jgi:hypothetical protein
VTVFGIALIDVARFASLDPVRLRDGGVGDRIERIRIVAREIHAVALVVVEEIHGLLRLIAIDHDERHPVDADAVIERPAQIRMRSSPSG